MPVSGSRLARIVVGIAGFAVLLLLIHEAELAVWVLPAIAAWVVIGLIWKVYFSEYPHPWGNRRRGQTSWSDAVWSLVSLGFILAYSVFWPLWLIIGEDAL